MRETGTATPGDRASTASTAWHFAGPTSTDSPSSVAAATPPNSRICTALLEVVYRLSPVFVMLNRNTSEATPLSDPRRAPSVT